MKDSVCIRCEKKLDYKPTRLLKQVYALRPYKQYKNVEIIDLCKECYDEFEQFLNTRFKTPNSHVHKD
jgi:hypothetical protein